jgi:hypothetical protein
VALERPVVDTGEAVKSIASADTMEEAVELANRDVLALLQADHGTSKTEAYLFFESGRRPRDQSGCRPPRDRQKRGPV